MRVGPLAAGLARSQLAVAAALAGAAPLAHAAVLGLEARAVAGGLVALAMGQLLGLLHDASGRLGGSGN